jgi:large subunit ribosomal protein L24
MSSHFTKYSFTNKNYYQKQRVTKLLGISRNSLRSPKIDKKFKGVFKDQKVDLRDKEHMDMSEAIRGPLERDFYQDHTYHSQWLGRDLDKDQKRQISSAYRWMMPGFRVEPWIWHPGDLVEVVEGEFAGQRGTVLTVVQYKNQCMVQNINVQAITIPATETRPEQVMQREHPISVKLVKLVDPSTSEVCDVKLVTVRNKETGAMEPRRISMATGVLMPVPKRDEQLDSDPLHDTPLEDAEELTYQEEVELPIMVQRKLRAMEDAFVLQLKQGHAHHGGFEKKNARDMRNYNRHVVRDAELLLVRRYRRGVGEDGDEDADEEAEAGAAAGEAAGGAAPPRTPSWWFDSVRQELEAELAAEAAGERAAAPAGDDEEEFA